MAQKTRKTGIFQAILLILNILAAMALILAYVAQYVSPTAFWYLAFFGLAYPVIAMINVFFILLWILLWRKFVWLSLITLLIGWNHLTSHIQLFGGKDQCPSGTFGVLSYNIHRFAFQNKGYISQEHVDSITNYINGLEPDVICFQEYYAKSPGGGKQEIEKMMLALQCKDYYFDPYYHRGRKMEGLMIFSKYPIINKGNFYYRVKKEYAIFADIAREHDTIRVFNVHLESIRFVDEDYAYVEDITGNNSETTTSWLKGAEKIGRKLVDAFRKRSYQAEMLRAHIDSSDYPVIVCGDFNDSPDSYAYRKISGELNDAFRKSGKGFLSSTYRGRMPSYRIDYILYDDYFSSCVYRRGNLKHSDHFPVFARMMNAKK
ncbi:MAG: hypothetical protein FJY10_10885 [Bacteroidetes bacterium]|nr:hypothetical protein [Bacteroidota bacterium]